MSDKATLLMVEGLNVGYRRSQILFDIDFTAQERGITAILGRNGAGKTTFLKALMGEIRPISGRIHFAGKDLQDQGTEQRVRRGLGYVPQEEAVFGSLTVRENLRLGAILARDNSGLDEILHLFPSLGQRLGQTAGTLSGGERKMLAIGRALLGRPRLLLLDEPTEGVWVSVIENIVDCLCRLATGHSIILVEQHLELALRLAERAYVLDRGRFVVSGTSADVREHPNLLGYLAP